MMAGMRRRDPYDRRARRSGCGSGCGLSLVVVLLLVAGLAVAAEFGARWYLGDRIEREAADRLAAPVSAGFGPTPVLWTLATDRSVDTVHLTSPGNATLPRFDVTARGVRLIDGALRADTADGTATVSEPQLVAAAADGNPTTGSPVGGLTDVRSVRPDAAAGLLRADIGGLADVGLTPGVSGGRLTLTPQETSVFGFPLPDGLFSGITGTVATAVDALPEGVAIDGVRVVDDGLEVHLGGRDVRLR